MGLFDFLNKNARKNKERAIKESPKEISNLEKAGLIFFRHQKYFSALLVFTEVLEEEPSNANIWYGTGNCIAQISNILKRYDILSHALACFKTAMLSNEGGHRLSEEFVQTIRNARQLSEKDYASIVPADLKTLDHLHQQLELSDSVFLNEFSSMETDRMVLIMFMADSAHFKFFPFLKYAITKDPDVHVRYAALKRAHLYKKHSELENVFEQAIREQKSDELEPYLSMALEAVNTSWTNKFKQNG